MSEMGVQANAQREMQLVGEWLTTLPAGFQSKTHVNVGRQILQYNGQPLSPALQNAYGVWNDWADARVYTASELWIVEAKIVGTGCAYGQVLDYVDEYPTSADYAQFPAVPIVPVVLCAYARERPRLLFAKYGVRTVIFTPSWAAVSLATKVFAGTIG